MFLKSLVIRGFKSFADKTTLEFEPGITIVVGPNGSGKSNVVDSISWVLGEQGARSLRGTKMEDVIFAGSRLRPALGMAEVSLTIDNSSGVLPIEFSEVTITRVLFRSGESEYRLNGAPCRLLDIQEVLSDSGIGREQHTIIGQGQLDAILNADPIQMRGFIEEAAGVAKHRRRKERALRKIASTEQNVVRLSDLLSEIRRQLRPLREQAEVAKKHAAVAEEFSMIRLIMAARELSDVRSRLGSGTPIDLDETIRQKERELSGVEVQLTEAEASRASTFVDSERQREAAWSLARAVERLQAVARLAAERTRSLEAELASTTEAAARAKVSEIERQVAEINESLFDARAQESSAKKALEEARLAKQNASAEVRASEDAVAPLRASHRDAVQSSIQINSELSALIASREAAMGEASRTSERAAALDSSIEEAAARLEEERRRIAELDSSETPLGNTIDEIEARVTTLEEEAASLALQLRDAERQAAHWRARAELRTSSSPEGARRVAARGIAGVVGILADLVEAGDHSNALQAVTGSPQAVVVVADREAATQVLAAAGDEESIGVLIAEGNDWPVEGAARLADIIEIRDERVRAALSDIYIADSPEAATRLAREHPHAIFVTPQGAVANGRLMSRGPADVAARALEAEAEASLIEASIASIQAALHDARAEMDDALARLNEADAAIAAAAERLAGYERELHALQRERAAITESQSRLEESSATFEHRQHELELQIPELESSISRKAEELDRMQDEHSRAVARLSTASAAFDEARMAAGMASERTRLLEERQATLATALARAVESASGVGSRREVLAASVERVSEVIATARRLEEAASGWAAEADEAYRVSRESLRRIDERVTELRTERSARAGALDDMRIKAREEDLGRSELRIRGRILEERMREEWQVDPDEYVSRYGHHWEVADPSRIDEPLGKVAALDEESLRRRYQKLERDLANMGRVNPLAAQEFEALTEREEFLAAQIADVRASRRDLFKVVTSVDDRVRELFGSAYEDVAREYERLFALLFPGGQGRLRLTDPADLLATGVEVEARPGGKNLKKLSLLSGGERALSALAVLFAIFRARPSPFYVLDEVEAALDDVNLHRFLNLLKEFRDSSQLLVVSHQKRTMEIADVLYGVSIKPDGASRVISERLSSFDGAPEASEQPRQSIPE